MQLSTIISGKGDFVATVPPDATISDVIQALTQHRVGALVVSTDGRTIAGIVSERDIVRGLAEGAAVEQPVSVIMTKTVYCAPPETHVDELMHLMTEKRVRHIPVTDPEGSLIGIVSIGDIVKTRLGELEGERAALLEYVTRGG
jgi:CBS domain-containing protein